jgi:hypothetical protein
LQPRKSLRSRRSLGSGRSFGSGRSPGPCYATRTRAAGTARATWRARFARLPVVARQSMRARRGHRALGTGLAGQASHACRTSRSDRASWAGGATSAYEDLGWLRLRESVMRHLFSSVRDSGICDAAERSHGHEEAEAVFQAETFWERRHRRSFAAGETGTTVLVSAWAACFLDPPVGGSSPKRREAVRGSKTPAPPVKRSFLGVNPSFETPHERSRELRCGEPAQHDLQAPPKA